MATHKNLIFLSQWMQLIPRVLLFSEETIYERYSTSLKWKENRLTFSFKTQKQLIVNLAYLRLPENVRAQFKQFLCHLSLIQLET